MKAPASMLFWRLLLLLPALPVVSCNTYQKDPSEVIVHELSDPDMLNPINHSTAGAIEITRNIHQRLIDVDFRTTQLIPVLADSLPTVEYTDEGKMRITYHIRPEAEWDNGKPVTASDVAFTMKATLCPKVDNQHIKTYLENIQDVTLYEDAPKKVTFLCDKYIRAKFSSGAEVPIIPAHIYDPNGLLSEFTVRDMVTRSKELAKNPKIIDFAQQFNSEKYQRQKGHVVGSGAYKFMKWETGQRIILERKKDWWGDQVDLNGAKNNYFEAHASRIIYQIIKDQTAALSALKSEKLDVMGSIKPKDFVELPGSMSFTESFDYYTAPRLVYSYLGINTEVPKLSGKYTRQALAHLVDVERVIEKLAYGYGKRVVGPVHPSNEYFYNDTLQPYPFDREKAKKLLKKDGWQDSDGNGTLDKMIDGEFTEFTIDFTYPSGNDSRKAVGLMFQEEARKIGIRVSVIPQEWSIYVENQKDHKFEMGYGAWIQDHAPQDPKQLFHTRSANGGSNYCSFGDEKSDRIIDSIGVTIDKGKRRDLWYKLQAILHERVPYIFMMSSVNRLAIHKRFENTYTTSMNPGYWEAGFKVPKKKAGKNQ